MLPLRTERRRRGWSLTRVSGLTGIAITDLSRLERGLVPQYKGWRKRISDAFGVSEEELFAQPTA